MSFLPRVRGLFYDAKADAGPDTCFCSGLDAQVEGTAGEFSFTWILLIRGERYQAFTEVTGGGFIWKLC